MKTLDSDFRYEETCLPDDLVPRKFLDGFTASTNTRPFPRKWASQAQDLEVVLVEANANVIVTGMPQTNLNGLVRYDEHLATLRHTNMDTLLASITAYRDLTIDS